MVSLLVISGMALLASLIFSLAVLPDTNNGQTLGIDVFKAAVIPLDEYIDRWWLFSISLAFKRAKNSDTCRASAAVVESRNCTDLPVKDVELTYQLDYIVAGSIYNITVLENSVVSHVWLTSTIDASAALNDQLGAPHPSSERYMCDKTYADATCFSLLGKEPGTSIVHRVPRAGYYTVLFSNTNDTQPPIRSDGVDLSGSHLFTYDLDAIEESHHPIIPWSDFDGRSAEATILEVSRPFNFEMGNCALLSFSCSDETSHYVISLGAFSVRWDVPTLATILFLAVAIILGCAALMTYVCYRVQRKHVRVHVLYPEEDHVV